MLSSDYNMLNIATLCTISTLWLIEQFHSQVLLPPVYKCSYWDPERKTSGLWQYRHHSWNLNPGLLMAGNSAWIGCHVILPVCHEGCLVLSLVWTSFRIWCDLFFRRCKWTKRNHMLKSNNSRCQQKIRLSLKKWRYKLYFRGNITIFLHK